jgi:mRNA interferase MazF
MRAVLVVGPDVFNERSGTVIALAVTRLELRAGLPLTLQSEAPGLPKPSWIKISGIRTLAFERIGPRLARVSRDELARVVEGLDEIVGEAR